MRETRIIVAGSRDFSDYNLLKNKMLNIIADHEYQNVKIVSGTARGADRLGEWFAEEFDYNIVRFPAAWDRLGKSAGYIRNEEMAKYAISDDNQGVLVAFWDGASRGTKHMIDLAKKYDLEVIIVQYKKEI